MMQLTGYYTYGEKSKITFSNIRKNGRKDADGWKKGY